MTIGEKINVLRKNKGLSQTQLGKLLNVSNKAVSKWERNTTCPDISLLPDLAAILGVTIDEILRNSTAHKAELNIERRKEDMSMQEALLKFRSMEDGVAEEVLKGTTSGSQMIGVANIPADHEGAPVKRIAEKAFYMCPNITDVIIPNSVEEIGVNAFYGCKGLTEVVIPDSVTKIGASAFLYCDKLVSVKMGASVTEIESNAFANCSMLKNITLPKAVKLGAGVFSGCKELFKMGRLDAYGNLIK